MSDINLIPQEEKQEQVKEKAVKASTIWAIVIFVIVLGIGGYLFYQTNTIKQNIAAHKGAVDGLRLDIQDMEVIEINARNLSQRFETLKEILNTRNHYSHLLTEFEKRVPDTIEIDTFGIGRGSTINVSGIGEDYIAIAKFISDLSDPIFSGADEGRGALFTDVSLNSVNLDAQTNKARFFIVVTIDERLLGR